MERNDLQSVYYLNITKAINSIKEKDYTDALKYITDAISVNQNQPEAHNLLGVLAEKRREYELALRHYRAACALDPSYKPANRNLDRITSFYSESTMNEPDLGINDMNDEELHSQRKNKNALEHLLKK
jgi:uncharacterized protein HemY